MGQQCVAMLGYKALAITVLISRIAGAQIDNVHVVLDASTTVGPLEHFWESTGFCPPDPHQDFYKFIFTNDEIQNLAYIGSVPKQGIKQVRIHWLLDLVSVEKTAVEQLVVYNFTYLDRAMKLLIDNGLKPGFELMGNPSNFFSDFDDTKQIYAWRDLIASLAKHMIGTDRRFVMTHQGRVGFGGGGGCFFVVPFRGNEWAFGTSYYSYKGLPGGSIFPCSQQNFPCVPF